MACVARDYDAIQRCLLSDDFVIDDSVYVYTLSSHVKNGLQMNASAYLLRCAVASGSAGIVHLLTLESAPGSVVDPGAMRNLALQDAILASREDAALVHAITDDVRVVCSAKYCGPLRLFSLHQFSDDELQQYKRDGWAIFAADSTPLALTVLQSAEFRQEIFSPASHLEQLPVRLSHLHVALLTCFRQTGRREFAQALCLASSFRERARKAEW